MKTLKIAVLTLFATATVSAQDLSATDVPASLNNSFQQAYPKATDVEWELEGAYYKVEFDINRMDHEVWYAKDGSIVKKEMELYKNELPNAVATTLKKHYADYNIDDIEVIEKNRTKTYEIELEKMMGQDLIVHLSEDGSIIKKNQD